MPGTVDHGLHDGRGIFIAEGKERFEVEGHAYEKLRESGDYKEGIAAFTEKRKPNFTGA